MRHHLVLPVALAASALVAVPHAPLAAQQVSYARAEQLLPWNTDRLVSGDQVQPQWMKDGNRFWYRNKTSAGAETFNLFNWVNFGFPASSVSNLNTFGRITSTLGDQREIQLAVKFYF